MRPVLTTPIRTAVQLGPIVAHGLREARRPSMPTGHDYALLTDARRDAKPCVYPDLASLARRVLRERHGQALDLKPDRIFFRGEPSPRHVVTIYGEDQVGGRTRFIGYAWLKGQGPEVLTAALESIEPSLRVAA